MARTPMFDPLTSEARSPWLAGLTDACYKFSSVLDMDTDEIYDYPLTPVDDRRRIYQATLGNKLWMDNPEPVVRRNGIVITPEVDNFTINYLGGSVEFEQGSAPGENDFISVDATYIIDRSNTIENILSRLDSIATSASNFKGYFQTYEIMESTLGNGALGNYAIVGGEDNSVYIWNNTEKKWKNTFKETDLSNYYNKPEIDALFDQYIHELFEEGKPTIDTVGEIGQDYTDTTSGSKFHLSSIKNNEYNWKEYGDVLGVKFPLTIPFSEWSENSITVQDGKLLSNDKYVYFVSPHEGSYKIYTENNVRPKDVTVNGQITFICEEDPSIDLVVEILRLEVQS